MDAVDRPLHVLLAAAPEGPGVPALLEAAERASRTGTVVRLMLTDAGLGLLGSERLDRLVGAGVRASLCSHAARVRRIDPTTVPAAVRWSSVTAFLRESDGDARLWSAWP